MTIRTKLAALAGATALAVTGMTGVQVASAPPAAAASCTTSGLGWWSVYNQSCSSARHFNRVDGVRKNAPWAAKKSTSRQPVCWANATSFGVELKA